MSSMPFGKYSNKNTYLHRLDARFKLIALILLMVSVFLPQANLAMDFTLYFIMFLLIIILMKIGHIKLISLVKMMKPMTFMMIFILILNIFAVRTGGILIQIQSFIVYKDALFNTLYTFFKLLLTIALSLILVSTTKPLDLTFALEWYMHPLALIKVPVHIIAMIISLALRFIPTLMDETNRLIKAQASRGVDFENGNFKEKIKAITALIIPLFASTIQRSIELADAMEVRGYNPNAKRTRYRINKFASRDYISFVLVVAFFALIILSMIFKIDFYKGLF